MLRKLWLAVSVLCAGGCADEHSNVRVTRDRELAPVCAKTPVSFRQPLVPGIAADDAVEARFGPACQNLRRQDGLDFGDGLRTYTCGLYLHRNEGNRTAQFNHIEGAFGRRIDLSTIDELALEPDDIREHGARRQPTAEGRLPLETSAGFGGVSVTALIVTDAAGMPRKYVLTRGQLDRELRRVGNVWGALDLLDLRNHLGLRLRESGQQYETWLPSQCTIASVKHGAEGWIFSDMLVRKNCEPEDFRTFSVAKSGATAMTRRWAPIAGSIMCAD